MHLDRRPPALLKPLQVVSPFEGSNPSVSATATRSASGLATRGALGSGSRSITGSLRLWRILAVANRQAVHQ